MVKKITTRQQISTASHFKLTWKNVSRLIEEGIIPPTVVYGGRSICIFSPEPIATPKTAIESHREKAIRKSPNIKNKDNFTITIPRQEAIDIYSMRSKLPSAISGQIKGFDKLLQALCNLNDDFVTISRKNK